MMTRNCMALHTCKLFLHCLQCTRFLDKILKAGYGRKKFFQVKGNPET